MIDDRTKNMIAYDSVRTKSDAGVLVETDSLVWDNVTRHIRSEAFVRITEKNGRITTGYGFESDQDLINYRIKRPTILAPRWCRASSSPRSLPPGGWSSCSTRCCGCHPPITSSIRRTARCGPLPPGSAIG